MLLLHPRNKRPNKPRTDADHRLPDKLACMALSTSVAASRWRFPAPLALCISLLGFLSCRCNAPASTYISSSLFYISPSCPVFFLFLLLLILLLLLLLHLLRSSLLSPPFRHSPFATRYWSASCEDGCRPGDGHRHHIVSLSLHRLLPHLIIEYPFFSPSNHIFPPMLRRLTSSHHELLVTNTTNRCWPHKGRIFRTSRSRADPNRGELSSRPSPLPSHAGQIFSIT